MKELQGIVYILDGGPLMCICISDTHGLKIGDKVNITGVRKPLLKRIINVILRRKDPVYTIKSVSGSVVTL